MLNCIEGSFRQPLSEFFMRFLPGENFIPDDPALTFVSFRNSGIEDTLRSTPDVRPGAVAFDKGNDRIFGDSQSTTLNGDLLSFGGYWNTVKHRHKDLFSRFIFLIGLTIESLDRHFI